MTNLGTSDLLWGANICNHQLDEISAKTHLRIHAAYVNMMLEARKMNVKIEAEFEMQKSMKKFEQSRGGIIMIGRKIHLRYVQS